MRKLIALACLTLAACTPEEVQFFADQTTQSYQESVTNGLSDEGLERLITCESGGRPDALDPTGSFRGLGQFTKGTWNSVASRNYPWLVGQDPIDVDEMWQRVMIRALWNERGRQPWPVCGRKV